MASHHLLELLESLRILAHTCHGQAPRNLHSAEHAFIFSWRSQQSTIWTCLPIGKSDQDSGSAQIPRVGPFLNCSQAETNRPKTVIGTVPSTMPSIMDSTGADKFNEEPISTSTVSMAIAAWGRDPATAPAVIICAPRNAASDWRGAATKAFPRNMKAKRPTTIAGMLERDRTAMSQTFVFYLPQKEILTLAWSWTKMS